MKEAQEPIITAYFKALNGNVLFNSNPVPVYSQVPSGAAFPYIYFSDFTQMEDPASSKEQFCYDCTITLVCAMVYQGNQGGFDDVNSIMKQVQNLLQPAKGQNLSFLGFNCTVTMQAESRSFYEDIKEGLCFYKTLKFRHRIYEL